MARCGLSTTIMLQLILAYLVELTLCSENHDNKLTDNPKLSKNFSGG